MVLILYLLLQAVSAAPAITLAEAQTMSPSALADRLLADRVHGPVVDAIINGGGVPPPSASVNRIWLAEQMVPLNATTCRSHVFEIEMGTSDPTARPYVQPVATHPIKIEQYDRLWVPPRGDANVATCAAAPAHASGFGTGGLGLEQAAALVEQARATFSNAKDREIKIRCRGEDRKCGNNPRTVLSALDWSALGLVEQVSSSGEPYYMGDVRPRNAAWGPAYVQFTFPYAASGATWEITIHRTPKIVDVRMLAQTVVYH